MSQIISLRLIHAMHALTSNKTFDGCSKTVFLALLGKAAMATPNRLYALNRKTNAPDVRKPSGILTGLSEFTRYTPAMRIFFFL